jgi:imidazole glycerol-phosphate synthase subunit HisH
MIVIVDYGMGNLGSVQNMLKKIGFKSQISSDKEVIRLATKLILPGVGSFDNGMNQLNQLDLIDVLNEEVINKKIPILGICLGMQLMTNYSEEGTVSGLGWVDANTKKFNFEDDSQMKIPHMGWNYIEIKKPHPLLLNFISEPKFYFVHSYYVKCNIESDTIASTRYGIDFTSSFARENIMATQFHPEKSHKYGFQILKNFIEL